MDSQITTVGALEAIIGKTPPPILSKAIQRLDPGALKWLAHSPLMFASFSHAHAVGATIGGGPPGWVSGDMKTLRLPIAMLDDPALAKENAGFGSVFAIPSISDVIRINGRVAGATKNVISIRVEECYLHCGRALLRSDFWSAPMRPDEVGDLDAFVLASRFMALATADGDDRADLSPKGDAAGVMAQVIDGALWFADRPGNKRVDSFKNILGQPHIAGILLRPGLTSVVAFNGVARITTDESVRAKFAVQGKIPALATKVEDFVMTMTQSEALTRARLWPAAPAPEGVNPAEIVLGHYKMNKDPGLRIMSALLSTMPKTLQRSLEKAYRKHLY